MIFVWRSALIAAAMLCVWQAITLNMAEHYLLRAYDNDTSALASALTFSEHPDALALRAQSGLADGGEEADSTADLERALSAAPTAAYPAATLARVYAELGNAGALPLATIADRLGPSDWRAQYEISRVYDRLGLLGGALPHLARAMVGDRSLAENYFPALARVAGESQTLGLLAFIAEDPRAYTWWRGFFRYLARDYDNVESLRGVVGLREAASTYPLQEFERNEYVQRLRRDGLLSEAYLYWVNGLPQSDLDALGYIFDGGFQLRFANDAGFGWSASPPRNSGIRISRSDTYGASGDSALRLSFRGRRVRFSHVWQHLFLPAGDYRVSGRVRPDQLRSRRGLQWRLYCAVGESITIGESEIFSGTGDWRSFSFVASVPTGCLGQTLRLYSAGDRDLDHELTGTIWFDDLLIELQR